MHIERITYTESESIESFNVYGLKKWIKREQSVIVFLTDKDDENKADELAKQFVKEKLYGNKEAVQPEIYSEGELPTIQVDKGPQLEGMTLEQQIRSCKHIPVLKVYESMVKKDPILQKAFDETMEILKFHKL